MATNNFKPFATGSSANVTTQADYESLPALQTGFQSGKASSAQINKALRQSTFVSAGLAQAISNILNADVLDNGNQASFVAQIISALNVNTLSQSRRQRFTSSGSFTVPAGVTTLYLSGCAGGGGGGAGGGGNQSFYGAAGAGGGAGQGVIKQPVAVTPGQSIPINIGSAGSGGIGNSSGGVGASDGGVTSFGSLLTLQGGAAGGNGGNTSSGGVPGAGNSAGYPGGSAGGDGSSTTASAMGGNGGSCAFGGGGGGSRASSTNGYQAGSAYGYGAGGGGGGGHYAGDNATYIGGNGGAGAPGILILEW
uniref:glycine-rich domain-containing protein n=1 Tax=Enterobacter agglomerans TaxID=549 RepID=UPI004028E5E8